VIQRDRDCGQFGKAGELFADRVAGFYIGLTMQCDHDAQPLSGRHRLGQGGRRRRPEFGDTASIHKAIVMELEK
jgi:hypothetical protein